MKQSTKNFLEQDMSIVLTQLEAKLKSTEVHDSVGHIVSYLDVISDGFIQNGKGTHVKRLVLSEFSARENLMVNDVASEVLGSVIHM